ncbi:AAA family ATPase [Kitasatospora sp. NPDC059722]|uniref:AAA family ATPase n=1 Tax=unclassified Kitasatospora TaxID=2633591 RepID=UPI003666F83D
MTDSDVVVPGPACTVCERALSTEKRRYFALYCSTTCRKEAAERRRTANAASAVIPTLPASAIAVRSTPTTTRASAPDQPVGPATVACPPLEPLLEEGQLRFRASQALAELSPGAGREQRALTGLGVDRLIEVIKAAAATRSSLERLYGALGLPMASLTWGAPSVGQRQVSPPARGDTTAGPTRLAVTPATPSKPGLKPTREQQRILSACRRGKNLVVEAGAGTGKTSTLKMACELLRGRGLYVAFNRVTVDDARASFPKHVDCRTRHSLAFATVGRHYGHRLGPRVPAERSAEILRILEPVRVNGHLLLDAAAQARIATEGISRFCNSADPVLMKRHLPMPPGLTKTEERQLRTHMLPFALKAWEDVLNPGGLLAFGHDHYLKIWALGDPKLPADFVMLDEAQDSPPVIAHVVRNQEAQRIAVGDSCQQLYAWLGAVDALANWPAEDRLVLSQSWRFGEAVAHEANKWLALLESPLKLSGTKLLASQVADEGDGRRPDVVLCRTNATAVARAIVALNEGVRPGLVGGGAQIRALAQAAITLQAGNGSTHPELAAFRNWEHLREYVRNEEAGADLRTFVQLIDTHSPKLVIAAVDAMAVETQAELVLSTAHRAKGREWNHVEIAGDFPLPPTTSDGGLEPPERAESMLAYVAVTRARLFLNRSGLSWVDQCFPY